MLYTTTQVMRLKPKSQICTNPNKTSMWWPPTALMCAFLLCSGCEHKPNKHIKVQANANHDLPLVSLVAETLSKKQKKLLQAWYESLGSARPDESFGELTVRAAMYQLDKPYIDRAQTDDSERLKVRLEDFQCVSFVESSLAVARCHWQGAPKETCFIQELKEFRYRHGHMDGYASRLHYFSEWLSDNSVRNRLAPIGAKVGARPWVQPFHFMTQHPTLYPMLGVSSRLEAIMETEQKLSRKTHLVLERQHIAKAQRKFVSGDLVGLVGSKDGLLITHAGFISRGQDAVPRLLHASSHHGRVLLTSSIAHYVKRQKKRRGIVVARPVAPNTKKP
jgi:hypothetical protein